MRILVLSAVFVVCGSQNVNNTNLHKGLTERIGNFSIELLYHTSKEQQSQNLIISPMTVWTALAVIAEGASGNTRKEINYALRIQSKNRDLIRSDFRRIAQWLRVNTTTVELAKLNAIFVDRKQAPYPDFRETARMFYETEVIELDFNNASIAANLLNQAISKVTHGRIPKIVDSGNFQGTQMILTSALYFRGQWTFPFDSKATAKLPFFNSNGVKIGEVNMMYNRHTYAFANFPELQARVIELPYGVENRLSMLIMLPNEGVSLENMFSNFMNITLDRFFEELRIAKEDYGDDEVDCFIPRFKIQTDLDITDMLKNSMGIKDLFDERRALLSHMTRNATYVSKVIHKAEIEVTEDGTIASGVTLAEFSNRIGIVRFQANKPFSYMIIEKVTNSIVFGGVYKEPSLY